MNTKVLGQTAMRIAFPCNDRIHVVEHFGHGKELSREIKTPPPYEPGTIPFFVYNDGAGAIITGGRENGLQISLKTTELK